MIIPSLHSLPTEMMELQNHPLVSVFWNFFPMTLIIWEPIRFILNLLFFTVRTIFLPLELAWNFVPETFLFQIINILTIFFGIIPLEESDDLLD